ncbi:MAG: DUF2238 domain-containing protein [Thiobacillus sp.]
MGRIEARVLATLTLAALVIGAEADAFLATQGDVWDTQWDMFLALVGANAAQLLLARA